MGLHAAKTTKTEIRESPAAATRWYGQSGVIRFSIPPGGPHSRFSASLQIPQPFPCRRVSTRPLGGSVRKIVPGKDSDCACDPF